MAFCKNCGAPLEQDVKFCPSCGTKAYEAPKENSAPLYDTTVYNTPEPKVRTLNIVQLVWSILSIVLGCMPLGVIALVMTIFAKSAATDEEEISKLKTAKILNIVSTVIIVLFVVIYVIAVVAMIIGTASGAYVPENI